MKRALLLLLFPSIVWADSLSWDAPTTREDGSPVSMTEIKEFRVYNDGQFLGAATAPSVEFVVPNPGTYKFTVTAVDKEGRESDHSDPLDAVVRGRPGKPVKLRLKVG